MNKIKYSLIDETGQYAVVRGLNKDTGNWDWTCCYYDFGEGFRLTGAEALFKALDYYLMRTSEQHISWARMSEIATFLKDGLIEDGEDEAYRYIADVVELSDTEDEKTETGIRKLWLRLGVTIEITETEEKMIGSLNWRGLIMKPKVIRYILTSNQHGGKRMNQ